MGFYNNSTPVLRRITDLTGDINLSEEFKSEIKARGIPIFQGYNIQKRLRFEAEEQEKFSSIQEVDARLMELLNEHTKTEVTSDYTSTISCESCEGATKVPPKPKEVKPPSGYVSQLPPREDIVIPPKGRDIKKMNEMSDRELLNKIILQNEKIINQNKLILRELKKLGE